MQRLFFLGLILMVLVGILYACSNTGSVTPTGGGEAVFSAEASSLNLTVQYQEGTYNTVGQTIAFQYVVTNTGTTSLVGPASITITNSVGSCQGLDGVGDRDNQLDPGEIVTCSSSYAITQADLNAGEVKFTVTVSVGGVSSNQQIVSVKLTPFKVLELTGNADRNNYDQANQAINFTFLIRNTGTASFGPAQFSINNELTGRINCLGADITLASGASISCAGSYTTKDADRAANQLTFNFTASGGGAETTQPLTLTVQNSAVVNQPGNYTPGTTITHDVIKGEWMLQIARCYGADLDAMIRANPQVKDPAKIWPVEKIVVPNIGSNGNIYRPPCIIFITAQASDTWNSIATQYNADIDVLREANQGVTLKAGATVRVPRNSAGGNPVPAPNQPICLNFPARSDKVTLSGTVTASKVKDRYVLTATQGQTLSVTLTAPTGGLELAVLPVSASALKFQNATLTFSGTIPSNGDYYIDVVNVTTTDRGYTLEVKLATPPAVTSQRVVDINPGTADGNPSYLTPFNNALYFSATGLDNTGVELWKYDAASNSLTRVKDIFTGAESSNPSFLAEYNGLLYFSANGNDTAGVELWRFNGTDTGRLTDINTGGNANPAYMTVYKGYLYFSATGGDTTGVELYRTDGTTTTMAADIYAGSGSSNPSYLTVYNDVLYFSAASNDGFGTELWKYDGTTASRVTDINPAVGNANPAFLKVYKNVLYFSANGNDGFGTELWKYDGTTASRALDINPGAGDSIPSYLAEFNGSLFFSANANNGVGYELWKFDGANLTLAGDINKSGDSFPSFMVGYNNQLYFQANGGEGSGKELWKYTGP